MNLLEIATLDNGYITASSVKDHGLQRRELGFAVDRGELVKVGRGLYCTPETWEDEYVIWQHRFARGVYSHDTALYLLGLSDSAPEAPTMSFPRGYNTSSARVAGVTTKSSPKDLHDLGVCEIETPYGNEVRVYNAERSLCDMLRGTLSPDLQIVSPAFRAYFSSAEKNLPMLFSYAQDLGVGRKVRKIMEVLL